jgi:menaquinone reductase, multiheme cytochrome c subunit
MFKSIPSIVREPRPLKETNQPSAKPYHYVFPQWSNLLLPATILFGGLISVYGVAIVTFGFSPVATDVGYQPEQPVPFSHRLHAGTLGIDCRYCHNTVEYAAKAAIPPTQTCMNCHRQIQKENEALKPLMASVESGDPVPWVRVHDLPDYAYFHHGAHVARGVGCATCHGRIDDMERVSRFSPLSMSWCLDCHRNPNPSIRPLSEVTNMAYDQQIDLTDQQRQELIESLRLHPSEDCSTCHR